MSDTAKIAAVVIGRNEGARLVACLTSLAGQVAQIVYVDSGSTDQSVQAARDLGAQVVELSPDRPFTAARGRNAGFEALKKSGDLPEFVHFFDGDCIVESGWVAQAVTALQADETCGIITGWRSEIHPERSIYNALCDFEWHRPAGDILTCGGDMAVRSVAFEEAGGFDPSVIAAEDDEFCIRLRKAGRKIHRLPEKMTRHDADMTRFGQWWQRAIRSGHGFAQVGTMHPPYFSKERRRVMVFGGVLPGIALIGMAWSAWVVAAVIGLYAVSYLRTVKGLVTDGLPKDTARQQAAFLSLSKFPNIIGMMVFAWRRLRGRKMRIIEYK